MYKSRRVGTKFKFFSRPSLLNRRKNCLMALPRRGDVGDLAAQRRKLLDGLISNLSNPRNAERLRIIQLVEDQLDAIQAEVRSEVQARLDVKTKKTLFSLKKKRKDDLVDETEKLRNSEAVKVSPPARFRLPGRTARTPLAPEAKASIKSTGDEPDVAQFEIVGEAGVAIEPLAPPLTLDESWQTRASNVALVTLHHKERPWQRQRNKLTAHVLPGVNIRPQLVIQSIPGLFFSGRRPKISSNNVVVDYFAEGDDSESDNETEGYSITDSTTSKFEAAERKLAAAEARKEEEAIKARLKQKVLDILVAKYNLEMKPTAPNCNVANNDDFPREGETETLIELQSLNMNIISKKSEPSILSEASQSPKVSADVMISEVGDASAAEPSYSGSFESTSSHSSTTLSDSVAVVTFNSEIGIDRPEENAKEVESHSERKTAANAEKESGDNPFEEELADETEIFNGQCKLGMLSTIDEVSSVDTASTESLSYTLKHDDIPVESRSAHRQQEGPLGQEDGKALAGAASVSLANVSDQTAVPSPRPDFSKVPELEASVPDPDMISCAPYGAKEEMQDDHLAFGEEGIISEGGAGLSGDLGFSKECVQEAELFVDATNQEASSSIKDNGTDSSGEGGYCGETYVKSAPFAHLVLPLELSPHLMNISQGDLTQDEEEEEDLATNAPSILFDSDRPLTGPQPCSLTSEERQPELSPQAGLSSSNETATSPRLLSPGEVLLSKATTSEGEVGGTGAGLSDSADQTLRVCRDRELSPPLSDLSVSLSRGGVRKSKKNSAATNLLRGSRVASSSSLSEGEWRATPRQMQRFYTMAEAFGMLSQKNS